MNLRHLRFYRRQASRRNAMIVRELRRGWFGRLVVRFYTWKIRRREVRQDFLQVPT